MPGFSDRQSVVSLREGGFQGFADFGVVAGIYAWKQVMLGVIREVLVQAVEECWDVDRGAAGHGIVGFRRWGSGSDW